MRTLSALAALTLLLAGCGGGEDSDTPESSAVDFKAAVEACDDAVQAALEESTNGIGDPLPSGVVLRLGDGDKTAVAGPASPADFLIDPSAVAGQCMLRELDAPDSVVSTVSQATGLTGQQEASWDGVDLTYSYNGNVGFTGVFTTAD